MEPTTKSSIYQYGFGISAGFSAMAAGAWLAWPSSVIPRLKDGILEGDQISTMVALMDFGNILSPIPSSYLMDAIGRKLTLLISAFTYILASLLVIFSTDYWAIYLARVLAGIGKGISFAIVPIFLAEIANIQIRGALSTMFIGFLNIGMLFDYIIGPYVSYEVLNYANLVIPLLFATTFVFYPESPYYLLMKGREGSAKKALAKYRQVSKTTTCAGSPLDREQNEMSTRVEADMKNRARFVDLITTSSNRRALLIISALAFFQRSSGVSPTIAYSTTIMPKTGGGAPPAVYMIIFSGVLVGANYLAMPLVDRMGRKPLLLISSLSTAAITGMVSVYYFLERNTDYDLSNIRWIPYFGLLSFAVTYSLGIGFLPSTLVGELFPTNVKSYAGSVSAIMLAVVSFSVNKLFQYVTDTWGAYVMYWYFTIACIACAVFVQIYVFETKGKTFGDIQEILQKISRRSSIRNSNQEKRTSEANELTAVGNS